MPAENTFRKSGISPVGDITWGTHISHLYSSVDEFADVLAPYVEAGLSNNELCIWIYSSNISEQEIVAIMKNHVPDIKAYITNGDLILLPHTKWYLKDGAFSGARVTNQWLELIRYAENKGYEGVRAVGDTYWLTGYSEEFSNYEKGINSHLYNLPFNVICTYDLNHIDIFEFEEIIYNHNLSILKMNNEFKVIRNQKQEKPEASKRELKLIRQKIELKQKEKILLEILDSSTEGTFIKDYAKKTVIYSEQWLKRLGLERVPPELIFQTVYQRILPEDLTAYTKALQQSVLNRDTRFVTEFRIRDKNNAVVWVLEQSKLVYSGKGELSKAYGSIMDITGRKRYEKKINRQNMILQTINQIYEKAVFCENAQEFGMACLNIVESVIQGKFSFIGEIGEDGLLHGIAISDRGLKLCSMHDATGHRKPPGDFKIRGLYGSVLKNGKSLLTNEPASHPDSVGVPAGHPPIESFLGVPFFLNGKVSGIIASVNREGGFREEDREILEALTPTILEVLMRKRTEEALHQSEKQALALVEELKQADNNKNAFLNTLSHELRNPLATIVAGLSVLELSDNSGKTSKTKEIIQRQIDQLCRLVDDLLDLTRITNNKIELKKELLEMNSFVLTIAEDYKTLFGNKGIKLKTETNRKPVYANADPVRIKQIVGNLLHNALKFTDKGGEATLAVHEDKNEAVISVADTGIGIRPDLLQSLFKPFMQADNSLDRCNGGLGLGLSIVRGIAELHGGSACAESKGLGKGSKFSIHLPLAETKNEKRGHNIIKQAGRALRILLIEDNQDFADILCSMFEMLGHEAATARNGIDGVGRAKELSPDVIFCDIGLPGMNGFEVAEHIRRDASIQDVFMVALTGYAAPKDMEIARKVGFNRHLAKPVDMTTLRQVLSEV